MKRQYEKPSIKKITIESSNGLLVGSVTSTKVQVNKVEVEPFQDGFADEGGYKDISFD